MPASPDTSRAPIEPSRQASTTARTRSTSRVLPTNDGAVPDGLATEPVWHRLMRGRDQI